MKFGNDYCKIRVGLGLGLRLELGFGLRLGLRFGLRVESVYGYLSSYINGSGSREGPLVRVKDRGGGPPIPHKSSLFSQSPSITVRIRTQSVIGIGIWIQLGFGRTRASLRCPRSP